MKCKTSYCRNEAATRKNGRLLKAGLCHNCSRIEYQKKNPWQYHFTKHQQRAKARKIPWTLSFEEFKRVWVDSGKWDQKINAEGDWTLDRIDVNLGYEPGNVEVVDMYLNVMKWHEEDKFKIDFRWRKRWAEKNGRPIEECPF